MGKTRLRSSLINMVKKEKMMKKLITPEIRGSFVNLLKPKAYSKDQAPKYSMVIAIDKNDKFIADLKKAMDEVAIEKWGEVPAKLKTFLKDGDQEEEKYGWNGKLVFTASNKSAPGVLVKTEQGLVEPVSEEDIYSGAYYRCSVRPYAYEYEKSKGVTISLDNVLKTKDGEKFTSKTSAAEDFADFVESDWSE